MPIANDFTSILELEWDINFIQCYPNQELKITELCNLLQLTAGKHAELGGISYLTYKNIIRPGFWEKCALRLIKCQNGGIK